MSGLDAIGRAEDRDVHEHEVGSVLLKERDGVVVVVGDADHVMAHTKQPLLEIERDQCLVLYNEHTCPQRCSVCGRGQPLMFAPVGANGFCSQGCSPRWITVATVAQPARE